MNVILVQPPEPLEPVKTVSLTRHEKAQFCPPWDLLCLRTFLQERTRHLSFLADCRLFTDLELELVEAISNVPGPRIMVINTVSHALGRVMAVLQITRQHFPDIKIVLCGEFPSQFPRHVAAMPYIDYALAGDPEPILRNLLDYIDVEQRLHRVPGLIFKGKQDLSPYWLDQLNSLSVTDWRDVFWQAYRFGPGHPTIRAEIRIARGHSRLPADRAYGQAHQPLRIWPLKRVGAVVQKCAHLGVNEVFVADPPGVWTPQRLDDWIQALKDNHNTQPWGLQMLPTVLDSNTIDDLVFTGCRRLDFIFPSCSSFILKKYGCILGPDHISGVISELEAAGISVHARFWIGNPEESNGEERRVVNLIRRLRYVPASLEPFPFSMDSPIYEELSHTLTMPHLDDWLKWARNPWLVERPVALWGGEPDIKRLKKMMLRTQLAIVRSPGRHFKHVLQTLRGTNWIQTFEQRALALISPPRPHS